MARWEHTERGTYTSVASKWYRHLSAENRRRDLYECVVKNAQAAHRESLSEWPELAESATTKLLLLISTIYSHVEEKSDEQVKVMMYFDEAYALADMTLIDVFWENPHLKSKADKLASALTRSILSLTRPWTLYDMVLWCFACFRPHPIFALFLSTTSKFSLLAPTINDIRTAGGKSESEKICLQPPIVEFPFDACPDLGVEDGCITFSELKQVEFLARFGRTTYVTFESIYIYKYICN